MDVLPDYDTHRTVMENGDWVMAQAMFHHILLPAAHGNWPVAYLTGQLVERLALFREILSRLPPGPARHPALACLALVYTKAWWERAPALGWFPSRLPNWIPLLAEAFHSLHDEQSTELPPELRPAGGIDRWTGRDLALSPAITLGLLSHTLLTHPSPDALDTGARILRAFWTRSNLWQQMAVTATLAHARKHLASGGSGETASAALRELFPRRSFPAPLKTPAEPVLPSLPPGNPPISLHPTPEPLPTDLTGLAFLWAVPDATSPWRTQLCFATALHPEDILVVGLRPSSGRRTDWPDLHPIRWVSRCPPENLPLRSVSHHPDFEAALRRMLLG